MAHWSHISLTSFPKSYEILHLIEQCAARLQWKILAFTVYR